MMASLGPSRYADRAGPPGLFAGIALTLSPGAAQYRARRAAAAVRELQASGAYMEMLWIQPATQADAAT